MTDPVNHPPHYRQGGIECIDVIDQVVAHYPPAVAYHIGNALKYLWRAPHKGASVADLQKARWYIDRALEVMGE
jgi:hypothetical protein